jgi:hypothetical protein
VRQEKGLGTERVAFQTALCDYENEKCDVTDHRRLDVRTDHELGPDFSTTDRICQFQVSTHQKDFSCPYGAGFTIEVL